MTVMEGIKAFFVKVINNISLAVGKIGDPAATVDSNGQIVISEDVVNSASSKMAAIIVAGAGMFFLLFPFKGEATMNLGDQLIRLATSMWGGA